MTAPLASQIEFGLGTELAIAIAIGLFFGFFLERAGFGSSRRLAAVFYLYDMAVLKVMFSAIATAAIGLWLLAAIGWLDLAEIYLVPTFVLPQFVGGLVLGAGFVIGGYCPGTSVAGMATGRIDALTFGLGSGVAGLAGVALSQIDNVSPNLGQSYIIDSFMVVVFGGVGNLWGTLVGAMTLGVANKLLEPYAGAVLGKIALLVCIILFIQKRPRGLFALKGRAVEA